MASVTQLPLMRCVKRRHLVIAAMIVSVVYLAVLRAGSKAYKSVDTTQREPSATAAAHVQLQTDNAINVDSSTMDTGHTTSKPYDQLSSSDWVGVKSSCRPVTWTVVTTKIDDGTYCELIQQCLRMGYDFTVLQLEEPYDAFSKPLPLRRYLTNVHDWTSKQAINTGNTAPYVSASERRAVHLDATFASQHSQQHPIWNDRLYITSDGSDVRLQQSSGELWQRWRGMNRKPVIFGGESDGWPIPELTKFPATIDDRVIHPYLNSGWYVGTLGGMLDALDDYRHERKTGYCDYEADQCVFMQVYLNNKWKYYVDVLGEFSINLNQNYSTSNTPLHRTPNVHHLFNLTSDGFIEHMVTGMRPIALHWSGPGKQNGRCTADEWALWTGPQYNNRDLCHLHVWTNDWLTKTDINVDCDAARRRRRLDYDTAMKQRIRIPTNSNASRALPHITYQQFVESVSYYDVSGAAQSPHQIFDICYSKMSRDIASSAI